MSNFFFDISILFLLINISISFSLTNFSIIGLNLLIISKILFYFKELKSEEIFCFFWLKRLIFVDSVLNSI